jgi:hypothetical protein
MKYCLNMHIDFVDGQEKAATAFVRLSDGRPSTRESPPRTPPGAMARETDTEWNPSAGTSESDDSIASQAACDGLATIRSLRSNESAHGITAVRVLRIMRERGLQSLE